MKKIILTSFILATLVIFGVSSDSFSANYTIFSSLADFQNALGSQIPLSQDFEGLPEGTNLNGNTFLPKVAATSNMDTIDVWVSSSGDKRLFARDTVPPNTRATATRTYYDINITLPYYAVGFNIDAWDPLADGPGRMEVFFIDGTNFSTDLNQTSGSEFIPVFFGIIADSQITRIRWSEPPEVEGVDGWEETALDDFAVVATPVTDYSGEWLLQNIWTPDNYCVTLEPEGPSYSYQLTYEPGQLVWEGLYVYDNVWEGSAGEDFLIMTEPDNLNYFDFVWEITDLNNMIQINSGGVSYNGSTMARGCEGAPCATVGDTDNDGICDDEDNCLDTPNGPRLGTCVEGLIGNTCTSENDCGGATDSCSSDQEDTDGDEFGDVCDPDDDNDGVCDTEGTVNGCTAIAGGDLARTNPAVCGDTDNDGCDDCSSETYSPGNDGTDTDIDGICDTGDNCPGDENPDQSDMDGDSVGDFCDNCPDPGDVNPRQEDYDDDGIGDKCDPDPRNNNQNEGDQIDGAQFIESDPEDGRLYLDAEVTFDPPPGGFQVFTPTPYNIVVRLFRCDNPDQEVLADQVLCAPPCSLEDLVVIQEETTYTARFPIYEWFNLQPNICYIAESWYVSYCDDLDKAANGDCLLDTPPDDVGNCEEDVLLTETPLGSDTLGIQEDGTLDQCPEVDGSTAGTGCPYADRINVWLHSITQGKGKSTKVPLAGAKARVFDRNNEYFQSQFGKNPKGSMYAVVYETIKSSDEGLLGTCTTGTDGTCHVGEEQMGDYLVIIKWVDTEETGKTVYVGRPKGPEDFEDGIATKNLQIIYMTKKNGDIVIKGGKKTVVTGSYLEIISPESAIWEGTESVYPFIFTSDSDWTVDLCARVPSGYSIVGVYDENGNLIPAAECIQTFVNGETKVVAFEVEEIGSPEPWLDTVLKVKSPKGKKVKKKLKTFDLRKKTFKSKVKKARAGLKRYKKLKMNKKIKRNK